MGEPGSRIVARDGLNGEANGLLQGLLRSCADAPRDRLELGESLLDRGEIWGRRTPGRFPP
jgi:hypothetical protein